MFKKYPRCDHILLIGKQGTYKDVTAVKWCYEGLSKGKKIFSNMKLGFPHNLIRSYDDMLGIVGDNWNPAMLYYHDLGRVFNARDWNRRDLDRVVVDARRDCVNNLRKRGVSLIGTCHDENEVDIDIRRILDWFVYCDFKNTGDPVNMEDDVVMLRWFDKPKDDRVGLGKPVGKTVYTDPSKWVGFYNTLEEASVLI